MKNLLKRSILSCLLFFITVSLSGYSNAGSLNADVVVIGAGGSGLTAALTAVNAGASVIVFEKNKVIGGSTRYAEGIFAVESRLQREKNIALTIDDAFNQHMEYTHWQGNPRLIRAVMEKSADTIEWLMDLGVEIIDPENLYPGGNRTWHTIKGFGKAIIKALDTKLKEKNVDILTETPAKKLVVENGRVVGVIAEDKNGKSIRVNAKAVIISTGGFAENREMLEKYTRAGPNLIPIGNENKTGDGINMAWEAGADSVGMDLLELGIPVMAKDIGFSPLTAVLSQPYLWVNKNGIRFFNEGYADRFTFVGNVMSRQKDQIMFIIYDEDSKKYMMEKGIDIGVGQYIRTATKLKDLDKHIERGIRKGEVFVADSIEELAVKIGLDEKSLKRTVDEYNQFCNKRHDDSFSKNPKYLHPVKTPKFYAHRGYPTFVGTLGGIKINEKTEVVNKQENVIPGLYATGNCAGGLYGDSYNISASGLTLAYAINTGRIAGENAVMFIRK